MTTTISLEIKRTKVCRECKTEKSINEFGNRKQNKDGISNVCKDVIEIIQTIII